MSVRTLAVRWSVVAAALLALGCGRGVRVDGRLLENGRPYTIRNEEVRVFFEPAAASAGGPEAAPVMAVVGPWDNAFVGLAPDGAGLPPGDYRVSVLSVPYQSGAGVGKDKFRGKYFGAGTPLRVTLAGSRARVTIDVGTGTATAE